MNLGKFSRIYKFPPAVIKIFSVSSGNSPTLPSKWQSAVWSIMGASFIWRGCLGCLGRFRKKRWEKRPTGDFVEAQVIETAIPSFVDFLEHINQLLTNETHISPEVIMLADATRVHYPRPLVQVVPGDVWGGDAYVVIKTHLVCDFAAARHNAEAARQERFTEDDLETLRLLLTHACGWSATYANHLADPWIRYLRAEFGNYELRPILDTLYYGEEIHQLPTGLVPGCPSMFLLGDVDSYFIYAFNNGELYKAGVSLKEVYDGLKDDKWHGNKEGDWVPQPPVLNDDPYQYFPIYTGRNADGSFAPEFPQHQFLETEPQ